MGDATTHRTDRTVIDEQSRRSSISAQWLLENEHVAGTHPITQNNVLEPLRCGEESFARIAQDIEAAVDSIDLICWGFDPGMELVRRGSAWPRGQPYGSLLDAAAGRGVRVRLLVWYEAGVASQKQNNMPGFTGDQREGYLVSRTTTALEDQARLGVNLPRTDEQVRNDYCVTWWRRVQAESGRGSGIELMMRRGAGTRDVRANLRGEQDMPSSAAGHRVGGVVNVNERMLIEEHATHHQKTVLIDYAWRGGEKAVGYVMGLNSITDYWDTTEHAFDTKVRETDWARKSETAQALPAGHEISRDPYQDYVCRIVGPALQGVHKNFVDGWKRAGGKARADDADVLPAKLAPKVCSRYGAQIVRTQPDEGDKTIKDTYFHAPQFARHYIYIENQYFFYESWVRQLKDKRKTFMAWLQGAGKDSGESPLLHLFVVIPHPEDDGMVPRTYDMVKSLGEAGSMPGQHEAMNDKEAAIRDSRAYDRQKQEIRMREVKAGRDPTRAMSALPRPANYIGPGDQDAIYSSAQAVSAPTKNHTTGELEGLGLKVLIGRLITFNRGTPMPRPELNYRQIYVHSKLMVIDDAFFTLGSANLNQRSMAADSEINVATDDHPQAYALRQKVWAQHAGGYKESGGGSGDRVAIAKAFSNWQEVMAQNQNAMLVGDGIVGYLIPFVDKRRVNYRYG